MRASLFRKLLRNPLGVVALGVLITIALAGVLAPVLAPFDPNFSTISKVLASPDGSNLLGTDSGGRDVLSRLLYGARTTLLSAVLCAAVAISLGLPAGLVAGYYGGRFDAAANWVSNMVMALPGIVMLLGLRAAVGPSVWLAMVAFGVLISPSYYRLTRTAVQSVRNELYVDAAQVSGLGDGRIIARHILSVVRAPVIIQTALICAVAIAVQSGLDFLGLGDPTVPSWGSMLSDGFRSVYQNSLNLLWPALAIAITVVSLVLLGNALRDSLEDAEKVTAQRRRRDGEARTTVRRRRTQEPVPVELGTEHHLLKVTGLGLGYPQSDGSIKKVVDDVTLHVDRGEVLGLVGESGSGKTQTAFAVLGLLPDNAVITGGTIQFDGSHTVAPGDETVEQSRLRDLRGRRIGYIPQEPMSNLDPAFTVGHQLTRPMVKLLGISKDEARRRALDLLASVGIPDPARTFRTHPHHLSGGMAQRVLIAGAISCEPDLVIADEPTTALDVTVQAEVLDVLRDLQHRLQLGIVLVTHNFGVVADICDRVVVMRNGRLVEEGPVRTILREPAHDYTRELLDSTLEGKTPMTPLLTATPSARVSR
ncbi:dipeptide/oligopeptide/nickel ABC transporter permease/ATP-binding protein [Modestobacter roseus]|uniref:dipeptide/oligopeptide/nickel ABC transporter permease/ATP-binding protein n=1 Tax=Modestobacter roseus TaxID=1181884 RepID=UPI0034DFEB68